MPANKPSNRDNWDFTKGLAVPSFDILEDRKKLATSYFNKMLDITCRTIFEYDDVPETLSIRRFEMVLQVNGFSFVANAESKNAKYPSGIYAFSGMVGGIEDPNGLPTMSTINNPALLYNKVGEIGKDSILVKNDSMFMGLTPIFSKYASLFADSDITLDKILVNSRMPVVYAVSDESVKKAFDALYEDIRQGKSYKAIVGNPMFESIKSAVFGATGNTENAIKAMIELQQYLKGSWYMEFGLPASFNSKREYISTQEATMSEPTLLPLIDDMLRSRKEGIEEVNRLYGTNISVRLSDEWAKIREDVLHPERAEAKLQEAIADAVADDPGIEDDGQDDTPSEEGGKDDDNP